jgi:hypothetical protein
VNGFLIFRKATVLSVGLKAWNTLGNIAKVRSMAMASLPQLILNIKNRKYSKANLSITLYKERANIYTIKVVRESNMKVNGLIISHMAREFSNGRTEKLTREVFEWAKCMDRV